MRINKPLILLFTFLYLVVSGFGITADKLSVFSVVNSDIFNTSALINSAEAEDVLSILTPANGSVVSHDISSFSVNLPQGATETIFFLDGKTLGKGNAEGIFNLSESLTLGRHTLTVSAIYDDGSGEKVSSEFTVAIFPQSQTEDFEEYASVADTKMTYTEAASAINLKAFGDLPSYYIASDGSRGYVLKAVNETSGEITCSNSYVDFYAFSDKSVKAKGKMCLEFDFNMSHPSHWAHYMAVTPYYADGQKYSTKNIMADGSVAGIGTLAKGWHTFKGEFDLDNMTYSYSIDETKVTNAQGSLGSSASGILYYRVAMGLYSPTSSGVKRDWAIDNIKTYEVVGNYLGADEILFEDSMHSDADPDGFVSADSAAVSRSTQKLVLNVDRKLLDSTVTASNISVVGAGKNIPVTNCYYDDIEKTITLELDNQEGITGNGESYVKFSENIKFADGTLTGVAAINRFNLTADGFLIKSVDFKCGASNLFTSSQLDVGDVISSNIVIQNAASSDASLTAVLVVKSGNKIISVTPKLITAGANTSDYSANISAPALTTKENITASLIFVDDLKNALYIDSYDLI